MKIVTTFLFALSLTVCYSQEYVSSKGYEVLKEVTGDLDKDGIPNTYLVK
jgi:hypothetical protein